MATLHPARYCTFGDATRSEGRGDLRKYVLAQFRSDDDLMWMRLTRAAMGGDEVKYKDFKDKRPALKKNTELWRKIEAGVARATLVVMDPEPVDRAIRSDYRRDGATMGIDYRERDVAARTATALIAQTPLAWLPSELEKLAPLEEDDSTENVSSSMSWQTYETNIVVHKQLSPFQRRTRRRRRMLDGAADGATFTPDEIRREIGPGLRAATVLAARTHATFDVAHMDETLQATRDVYRSPVARSILREVLSVPRMFDNENWRSVAVLNKASEEIAAALAGDPVTRDLRPEPLVKEADSAAIDFIQAADLAAGWAREVIDSAGMRALGARFERVWVNGYLLRGPGMIPYEVRAD